MLNIILVSLETAVWALGSCRRGLGDRERWRPAGDKQLTSEPSGVFVVVRFDEVSIARNYCSKSQTLRNY